MSNRDFNKGVDDIKKNMDAEELNLKKKLNSIINKSSREIEQYVALIYQKYSNDSKIDFNKLNSSVEKEEYKQLVDEYNEIVKEDLQDIKKENIIEFEELKKPSKLDCLKLKMMIIQVGVFVGSYKIINKYLTEVTKKSISNAKNLNSNAKIRANLISKLLNEKWVGGTNFEEKLWEDSLKIYRYALQDMLQGFIRGDSYETIINKVVSRYNNVNRNDLYRLIYTEGTRVLNEASINFFENDYRYYSIKTAEDRKVCPICRDMQSKSEESPFLIKDRMAGVNFPPFHPWCRCTYIVEDESLKE